MSDKLTELIKDHYDIHVIGEGFNPVEPNWKCRCGETLTIYYSRSLDAHAEHLATVIRQYLQARPLVTRPPHECTEDCHRFGCFA